MRGHEEKNRKRREAEERQKVRNRRTPQEQMELILKRSGNTLCKEYKRLEALVKNGDTHEAEDSQASSEGPKRQNNRKKNRQANRNRKGSKGNRGTSK